MYIRSFSGPYFSTFGLKTEICFVNMFPVRMQECTDQKNSEKAMFSFCEALWHKWKTLTVLHEILILRRLCSFCLAFSNNDGYLFLSERPVQRFFNHVKQVWRSFYQNINFSKKTILFFLRVLFFPKFCFYLLQWKAIKNNFYFMLKALLALKIFFPNFLVM